MGRVIYAIKIMLFRSQFGMTTEETSGLQRFVRYSMEYYVWYWYAATIATIAPRRDLEYLQQLEKCDDREISTTVAKALNRHLWCLSEQLVSFAFFDDIDFKTKTKMLQAINRPESVSHPKNMI